MSKKTKKTKTGVKKITQFEIIRPNVAGIDVSDNDTMMVAYPINEDEVQIEAFECYTIYKNNSAKCFLYQFFYIFAAEL